MEFELIEYQMSRFNCKEGDNFFLKLTNFSNSFPIPLLKLQISSEAN